MTDWTLRPLTVTDPPLMAALHMRGFADPWTAETFAQLMAMPGAFGHAGARANDRAGEHAGFVLARCAADEAEIITLAVAPAHRRQGLGARLMELAARVASDEKAKRLFLEVASGNVAALALYRKLGFAEVGRRPAYYGRPGQVQLDALVMAKEL